MLNILFNLLMRKLVRSYRFKEKSQKHAFVIENIEVNVQIETSGFFHSWGEKSVEPLPDRTACACLQTRIIFHCY